MEDIIKIVTSLEDSNLLLKGVTETVQNEEKEQKGRFLSMVLSEISASLSGNILAGPGTNRVGRGQGTGTNRAGEVVLRASYSSNKTHF